MLGCGVLPVPDEEVSIELKITEGVEPDPEISIVLLTDYLMVVISEVSRVL